MSRNEEDVEGWRSGSVVSKGSSPAEAAAAAGDTDAAAPVASAIEPLLTLAASFSDILRFFSEP